MELIETLLKHLREQYILPDVAARVDGLLRPRMADYAALSGKELAERLTRSLAEITGDKHLGVWYSAEPLPEEPAGPTPEQLAERDLRVALSNAGFHKLERLPGNVGYLELKGFAPAEVGGETAVLDPPPCAGQTVSRQAGLHTHQQRDILGRRGVLLQPPDSEARHHHRGGHRRRRSPRLRRPAG